MCASTSTMVVVLKGASSKYGNEAFVPDKAREIALQSHRAKLTGPQSCDATNSQAEFNQLSRHALTVGHARHKTMCAAMSPGHLLPLENFRERPGGMVRLAPQQLINTNGVLRTLMKSCLCSPFIGRSSLPQTKQCMSAKHSNIG